MASIQKSLFKPSASRFPFGFDHSTATTKAIKRNVAKRGQESGLVEAAQLTAVKAAVQSHTTGDLGELTFKTRTRATCQFFVKILTISIHNSAIIGQFRPDAAQSEGPRNWILT